MRCYSTKTLAEYHRLLTDPTSKKNEILRQKQKTIDELEQNFARLCADRNWKA